jgi:hypothetical protein
MARFGKSPKRSNWDSKSKKRCQFENCRKRAKDFYEGKWLCRIHSPMREGYKTFLKRKK